MAIKVQSTILVTQLMARFYPPLRLLFSQCNEQPLNEALTSMGTSLGGQPAIILPLTVCYCLPNLTSHEPSYHLKQSNHLTIIPSCPSCHLTILTSHHHTILFILPSYNHAYLATTTRRTHQFLGIFVAVDKATPAMSGFSIHYTVILYYQQKPKINNSNSLAFCIL